mmetsp:Transcript_24283/g.29391  ORF Transcript_24283/g.29391 Transcript_24283/m.29391 type:complete len:217 (+) Transcript_24283:794-1444(+)
MDPAQPIMVPLFKNGKMDDAASSGGYRWPRAGSGYPPPPAPPVFSPPNTTFVNTPFVNSPFSHRVGNSVTEGNNSVSYASTNNTSCSSETLLAILSRKSLILSCVPVKPVDDDEWEYNPSISTGTYSKGENRMEPADDNKLYISLFVSVATVSTTRGGEESSSSSPSLSGGGEAVVTAGTNDGSSFTMSRNNCSAPSRSPARWRSSDKLYRDMSSK